MQNSCTLEFHVVLWEGTARVPQLVSTADLDTRLSKGLTPLGIPRSQGARAWCSKLQVGLLAPVDTIPSFVGRGHSLGWMRAETPGQGR